MPMQQKPEVAILSSTLRAHTRYPGAPNGATTDRATTGATEGAIEGVIGVDGAVEGVGGAEVTMAAGVAIAAYTQHYEYRNARLELCMTTSQDPCLEPQSSSSSHTHKPSFDEVYASAQVVMSAAKNKLHQAGSSTAEELDYGKLAGAAGTLIGAAAHYGKFEEGVVGKYAQKAQEYLHAYEIKHGKPGTTVPSSQPAASTGYGQGQYPPSSHALSEANLSKPSAPPQGYPTGYPPQGYPNAQQGYGYVSQGHNKPVESQVHVNNYPPVGYPPASYPSFGTNHNRPSKYS